MFSCCVFVFLSLLLSLLDTRVTGCDYHCTEKPKFSKSSLVVKFGDPASVTCEACQSVCRDRLFDLEVSIGKKNKNGTSLLWRVEETDEWRFNMMCYYTLENHQQCCSNLPITVYQPPEDVSISLVNHDGPMSESVAYTLQCNVQNVAPLNNLVVTFYKGQTVLGQRNSTNEEKKPASEQFTLDFTANREDNGVQFWCEAKLELGPDGPQTPPVVTSGNLTATVHYGPDLKESANLVTFTVIKGEPLRLDCSAEGNPAPSYTWTLPSGNSSYKGGVLTIESVDFDHEGQYSCTVDNSVKSVQVDFIVDVRVNPLFYILPIVIGAVLLVSVVAYIVYRYVYKLKKMGNYNLKDVFRFQKQHSLVPSVE